MKTTKPESREHYLMRLQEATQLKLAHALHNKPLSLAEPLSNVTGLKYKALCKCVCGWIGRRDISRMIAKPPIYGCASCSRRYVQTRNAATPEGRARLAAALAKAVEVNLKPELWTRIRRLCQVAKDRCVNPKNAGYMNYGGRGIQFRFESGSAMAQWVLDNLGPPDAGDTLDRRDNNSHYEAGNLRWASRVVQNKNKRPYIGAVYGHRLQNLESARPDLNYETLRQWVKQGLTDEQIIAKPRGKGGRSRV